MRTYRSEETQIIQTQTEMRVWKQVREGKKKDLMSSPSNSYKWYQQFADKNPDGISLDEAPIGKLLMVVTEDLGTFYQYEKGIEISRGSIIVKIPNNIVYCVDVMYWELSFTGVKSVKVKGYIKYEEDSITRGKVKEVSQVKP
ncbi:hypothetical protein P9X10_01490 [Bacillus cereus]|nr:hypothetical protein [Bacillus cereus]